MTTKAPKPRKPKREPDAGYVSAMVLPGEGAVSRFSHNPQTAAMVLRGMQQTAAYCISTNAVNCTQQRLRVFRKTTAKGGKFWRSRAVSRKRMAYLRGDLSAKPGRKAAEFADDAGDIEEVMEGPLVDLLRHPDPFSTGSNYLLLTFWFKEATGKSFTLKADRQGREPTSIYCLYPQWTKVKPHDEQFIEGYWYGRNSTAQQFYSTKDVIFHKHIPHPNQPFEAMSWPQTLQLETDHEQAAVQAAVNRWNNGGHPGMIISMEQAPPTNPATRKQMEVDLANQVRGVAKAGSTLFLFSKATVSSGQKPSDLDYTAGLDHIRQQIFRAADIPESMMQMSSASLANAYAADPQYARNCIHPRLCRVEDEFNDGLVSEFYEAGEYFVAFDNPIAEDQVAEVDRAVKLATAGLVKREVLAIELGYKPEDVGVDPNAATDTQTTEDIATEDAPQGVSGSPDQAAAAQSGSVQAEALNGAQIAELAKLAGQVAAKELPVESARAIAAMAYPLATPEQLDAVFAPLKNFEQPKPEPDPNATPPGTPDKPQPGAKRLEPGEGAASLTPHERGGAKAAGDTHEGDGVDGEPASPIILKPKKMECNLDLTHTESRFIDSLKRSGAIAWSGCCGADTANLSTKEVPIVGQPRQITDALSALSGQLEAWLKRVYPQAIRDDGSIDLTGFEAELQDILGPAMRDIMDAAAKDAAQEVGGTWGGMEANPRAVAYLQQHGAEMVRNITQTTREQLQTILSEGFAKGDTLNDIQARLRDEAPAMSANRAEVIARTETSAAAGEGAMLAYKENGVAARALLNGGGPCPICDAVAAKGAVPVDQPLVQAGEDVGGYVFTRAVYQNPVHPNCRCTIVPEFEEGGE